MEEDKKEIKDKLTITLDEHNTYNVSNIKVEDQK